MVESDSSGGIYLISFLISNFNSLGSLSEIS